MVFSRGLILFVITLLAICVMLKSQANSLTAEFGKAQARDTQQEAPSQEKPIPVYHMQTYDRDVQRIYKTLKTDVLSMRIEKISDSFLNKPYLLHAQGEGMNGEFDQGPLYRTDMFDCTTFVEMVLALAQAKNLAEFKQYINQVRYAQGEVAFVKRNHFMSVDWNKNNQQQGFIRDITDQLGLSYRTANTVIDKPNWYRHLPPDEIKLLQSVPAAEFNALLTKLHNYALTTKPETSQLKYIPLDQLYSAKDGKLLPNAAAFAAIPSGSIIEVVRPNTDLRARIGTRLDVLHMGLAIRTSEGLMFRHASKYTGKVSDIPLVAYLNYYFRSDHNPLAGINVQVIVNKA